MRRTRSFRRLAASAAALLVALQLLAAPGATAQDPPPSLCGPVATSGAGTVPLEGESADEVGECAIVTASALPAWAWFDATITIACQPASGSGTNRQVDGFYLWGITRDATGAIVSQGYVGTSWTGCGSGETATRTYHQQLALQGYDRTIVLRTERRRWPYGASTAVLVGRGYSGSAAIP